MYIYMYDVSLYISKLRRSVVVACLYSWLSPVLHWNDARGGVRSNLRSNVQIT